jgi:hypothetical protein
MRLNMPGWLMALALLPAALAGCTREHIVEVSQITTPTIIPLALQGTDTIQHLSFPNGDQHIDPGEFKQGEICYLTVGEFRVDCFPDGSSLNLGPNDSNDLLTDNPMSSLAPLHDDKIAAQTMKLYGILFLVGGSIDRLPGALSDYIGSPNSHLDEAVALTQLLLNSKKIEFQGFARGGNFVVTFELTDSGRDKLMDAMDEAGEPASSTQMAIFHPLQPRP